MKKVYEEISDEELKSLTAAIKNRYGVDFTNYETKSLKRGFARLITSRGMSSILELWSKILMNRDFFFSCIDDLTVNLTELFRNPELWHKVQDDILPELKQKTKINMWHAGCSTGEEVYTMAIVLNQNSLLYKCKTIASDLSAKALEKAKDGRYASVLIGKYAKGFNKYLPNGKIERNFSEEENGDWVIKKQLKRHVEFVRHNLVQEPPPQKFDVIFCRNVMIYFDDHLKGNVLRMFSESLTERGFLIVGYYDMLPAAFENYFELYDASTRVYRKKNTNDNE